MLPNLGMGEILIIFFVILIFFGAKRLPDLAKGMGKGIREFKNGLNDVQKEIEKNTTQDQENTEKKEVK